MNIFNEDKDNILSIVKSLRPIKKIYSKQNRNYDKYFRGSCLKDLVKHLHPNKKFNEFLKPGESLDEIKDDKSIMNINFKSTFNYIEELSNFKNIQLSLKNKSSNKNLVKSNKKNGKNKIRTMRELNRLKYRQNLINSQKRWDMDATLDPGKYHPKYDYIRKKCPCAFFGKPKNDSDINIHDIEIKKLKDIFEKKKKNEINLLQDSNDEKSISLQKIKNIKNSNPKNLKKYESNSNQTISYKNHDSSELYNKSNTLNKSIYNNIYRNNYDKKIKLMSNQKEKFTSSILKDQNTASSWTNTMDFENSRKLSEHQKSNEKNLSVYNNNSNINFYNTQRGGGILRKTGKSIIRNSSMGNLKCPFDKMQGRDNPLSFNKRGKEGSRTIYNPDYNIVRPHIPSFLFKSETKYRDFKKYITGKIIRSYCFNPGEYFAIEYQENKEKEMIGQYGLRVLKS